MKDMAGGGSRLWLKEADHTVLTCKSDASGHLGWGIAVGDELHGARDVLRGAVRGDRAEGQV